MTITPDRLRWISTGMYAKPGVPITVTLRPTQSTATAHHSQALHRPLLIQVGSHNWIDGSADHGVGWNVAWRRFPQLTTSKVLDPAVSMSVNITAWFGGMVYVDVYADLIGTEITLEVGNALVAPSFEFGVTTAADWAALVAAPAPYGEIETPELIFTVNASYYRHLSFAEMSTVASFWTQATCETMALFRQPAGTNRSKTRIVFDVVTADAGNLKSRWGQPPGDGGTRDYPGTAWAAGCEACVALGYPGDEESIFFMDYATVQHEGQWELQYMLGMREQLDMYHPSGFNTYLVLPNLAPMYTAEKLGMEPRDLSAWEAAATRLKAEKPGSPRSHIGRFSWYGNCPVGYPANASETDCLTNALLFRELAATFGWECYMNVFDFYARNLTQKTKVGNSDEKADNYWYWFLSIATQRDLTHFFNDDYSWAYDVTNNFHGTNYVPLLNLPSWMPNNKSDIPVKPCPTPVPAAPNCASLARKIV